MIAGVALAVGVVIGNDAPPAEAEISRHGKPVTLVIDEDDDDERHHGTVVGDVLLLQ